MKSVIGYTKSNDDTEKKIMHCILDVMIVMLMMQKKKMIHYILDIKKVMMVIMKKNNPLYVG